MRLYGKNWDFLIYDVSNELNQYTLINNTYKDLGS